MRRCCRFRSLATVTGLVILAIAGTVALGQRGCRLGTGTVVRCRQGHLYTTIWIPLASLKAVRLGWWRLQYCPVAGTGRW